MAAGVELADPGRGGSQLGETLRRAGAKEKYGFLRLHQGKGSGAGNCLAVDAEGFLHERQGFGVTGLELKNAGEVAAGVGDV